MINKEAWCLFLCLNNSLLGYFLLRGQFEIGNMILENQGPFQNSGATAAAFPFDSHFFFKNQYFCSVRLKSICET